LEERSATRAARRLNVTQSAVSNSLARLRVLLKDPLVVRGRDGLVPTPRGKELAPLVATAVEHLQLAVQANGSNDPARCTRHFTLSCADNLQIHDVPRIAAAMARRMPHARLRVDSPDYLLANDGLARGLVDLATGPRISQPGYFCVRLYSDTGVAVVRRDHPRVGRTLTRDLFNTLPHVDTYITLGQAGQGHATSERFFRRHRLERHVALAVPTFTAAAMVALRTDYIACLPSRVAYGLAQHLPLRVLELPARGLDVAIHLIWHARTHIDAAARYFRELVVDTLRKADATPA
jgi:DNA-binding transcriptional LysR family regulator